MTRRRILKFTAIVTAVFIAAGAAGVMYRHHANRRSAIEATITWARLAPLPPSAQNIQVEASGSMFSRDLVITFDAPLDVIQQWLAASPGPSSARQSIAGPITTYSITPGGGAQFAEVKVDSTAGRVNIHTYWS